MTRMSGNGWRRAWVGGGFLVSWIALGACSEQDKAKWDEMFKPSDRPLFGGLSGDTEKWTIECNEYLGERHRETAETAADALRRAPNLRGDKVRVEHHASSSRVYYGEYALKQDKSSDELRVVLNDAIKRDLEFIRQLSLNEQYIFFQARPIAKPGEKVGPPEWSLERARGTYTLHVGVTYATPTLRDYQEAAIEWVKDLRSRGYEAYYYHDPEKPQTSICVGSFGDDAFVTEPDGRMAYSKAVKDLQLQEEFRYNLENGHITHRITADPSSGKRERIPNWSFLVEIPQPGKPKALRDRKPTSVIPEFE